MGREYTYKIDIYKEKTCLKKYIYKKKEHI